MDIAKRLNMFLSFDPDTGDVLITVPWKDFDPDKRKETAERIAQVVAEWSESPHN